MQKKMSHETKRMAEEGLKAFERAVEKAHKENEAMEQVELKVSKKVKAS